jgi:hypothetical protein
MVRAPPPPPRPPPTILSSPPPSVAASAPANVLLCLVARRGRVRAASASAGTRRTRSASGVAAGASTSRRAPAPHAATPRHASASVRPTCNHALSSSVSSAATCLDLYRLSVSLCDMSDLTDCICCSVNWKFDDLLLALLGIRGCMHSCHWFLPGYAFCLVYIVKLFFGKG